MLTEEEQKQLIQFCEVKNFTPIQLLLLRQKELLFVENELILLPREFLQKKNLFLFLAED
jgi:hypothetical protein